MAKIRIPHRALLQATSKMMLPQMYMAAQGNYLVHPQIQATIPSIPVIQTGCQPFVVLSPKNGKLARSEVLDAVSQFTKTDDVFSADFLTDLIGLQTPGESATKVQDLRDLNTALGQWDVTSTVIVTGDRELPPGPYFLCGANVHQAWKLYPDDLDAFQTTVVPRDTSSTQTEFIPVHFLDPQGIWKNVAVPSRLYFSPSKEKPLAGKRISIKDSFRLMGIKSTLSSRPYEATYGPDTETAEFAQKLIDLGAVIIGKSKMSAFASAEEPTDQWVDFHAPFNPRGDGYQTPAGSSNGAAAALSGYPWLDFSIGTDTSGSVRYPAAICGLYGLRYTSHTISTVGIQPCCREFDAIGLLGTDLKSFHDFVALTVESGAGDLHKYPKRILYPTDFLPYTEDPVEAILEEFVQKLESFLGIMRTKISIADIWTQSPPPEAKGKTIKEFLNKTGFYPFYYDGYNEYQKFRDDYLKKFNKEPYVGPFTRWKWETGSKVTLAQKEEALQEMTIYRKWFAKNILRQDDSTASTAVMIMPLSCYAPDYRDTIHKEPESLPAHSENYLASLLKLPQLVLPVGQVPYDSRATGRTEHHPITASLVGAEGSDLMLINLARATLAHAGWGETLLTGRYTWKLGNGTRNVAEDPRDADAGASASASL